MPTKTIIECWASWCEASRRMAPRMAEFYAAHQGEIAYRRWDADELPERMAEYQIRVLPTLLLLDGEREVARLVGERGSEEITNFKNNP